jgi:hypothetical protein
MMADAPGNIEVEQPVSQAAHLKIPTGGLVLIRHQKVQPQMDTEMRLRGGEEAGCECCGCGCEESCC